MFVRVLVHVQLSEALSNTWFHGFLSYSESVNLLRGAKPGTFLIRFSQSSPCAFALVVVLGANDVQQFLIETAHGGGFKLGTLKVPSLPGTPPALPAHMLRC